MPRYNLDTLEACRQAVAGQAGPVGSLGDGLAGHPVSPAMFGTLDGAGALAQALSRFESTMRTELHAAEAKLKGVDRALDATIDSIRDTERAASASMGGPA